MSKTNIPKISGVALLVGLLTLCVNAYSQEEAYKEFLFAQGLYEDAKFDLAAIQFQKFIENFPENRNCDRAQYLLGECFWNQGRYEEAVSAFTRLVQKYPESDWVDDSLYQMGESYVYLGNYVAAIPYYERLIEAYPQSNLVDDSLYSLGYAHFKQKDCDESLRVYKRLRNEFPVFEGISEVQYFIAKTLYDNKRYPDAITEYSILISTYPTSKYRAIAYLERGLAYLEEKRYDKARGDFNAVGASLEKPGIGFLSPAKRRLERELTSLPEGDRSKTKKAVLSSVGGLKVLRLVEPPYPEWAQREGIKGVVELKCWILPNGEVRNVEVYRSSGDPRLDEHARRYLMMWKFEPIKGDKIQWGIVPFHFEWAKK